MAGLIIALPITSQAKKIPSHIEIAPPEGGLRETSFVMCEAIRSISKERFLKSYGAVSAQTVQRVEDCVRILLGL